MSHPVLVQGNVAVVTGGAAGIGLAAAEHFAALGMKVAIADLPGDRLAAAAARLARVAPAGRGTSSPSRPTSRCRPRSRRWPRQ